MLTTIFFVFLLTLVPPAYAATDLTATEDMQSEIVPAAGNSDAIVDNAQAVGESSPTEELADGEAVEPEVTLEEIIAKEETREREREAGEDPLAQELSEKEDLPENQLFRHNDLELYGSLRVRYLNSADINEINDGGSRAGLNGELQFHSDFWVLARAEVGFNLLGTLGDVFGNSGNLGDGENLSRRLLYVGVETPSTILLYGKNWSTYYQVSSFADRFSSFGGSASGTFNAFTDGGATGTGRADNVLQSRLAVDFLPARLKIKPFRLNLQLQPGQAIPQAGGIKYDYSFGLSAILETEGDFNLGIAYNQAVIDRDDLPVLKLKGINGDARALVLGTRVFGDQGYFATTVAFLENQETTADGIYFDGWGWELFSSYNLFKQWWVIGGLNLLEPYKDEPLAKEYRIRYGVLGLRYSFVGFTKMLYTEVRLDDSRSADGTRLGNVYSAGIRWDLP